MLKMVCIWVLVIGICFIMLEGVSGLVLFTMACMDASATTEESHTKYDPLLGWSNIPNTFLPDLYGPGKYLRINAQGFRNNEDITPGIPPGKIRIVCSGDSFTLGHSVSNDESWVARLATDHERIQTVNMGQGGYGVDQAYLWYMRDGKVLGHDVQLFSFITADFQRASHTKFIGYSKPVLRIADGQLRVENTPVPRYVYSFTWLRRHLKYINELRFVVLLKKLCARSSVPAVRDSAASGDENLLQVISQRSGYSPDIGDIVVKIFESLKVVNDEKRSTLVVVYFPIESDYAPNAETDSWRAFLKDALGKRGIYFCDLVPVFRALPEREFRAKFVGHFSVEGNAYVAEQVYAYLLTIPDVRERLSA